MPSHTRQIVASLGRRSVLGLGLGLIAAACAPAAAAEVNEDGLPLPRFASTRSAPINVRVGPGLKYDVAWIYNRADMPVEITAEFDIWRKIRDYDGSEGWVQQNLLSGNRTGLVAPWKTETTFPLLAGPSETAAARAYLPAGFRINLRRCDGAWCQVDAAGKETSGRTATFTGYLRQSDVWGAYQGEKF